MYVREFEELLAQYRNATDREDRMIKRRLEAIAACYEECAPAEREFADEITVEFCRLIALLKEQHQKKACPSAAAAGSHQGMAYLPEAIPPQEDDEGLIAAFYDHFRGEGRVPYAQLSELPEDLPADEMRRLINVTIRDYAARVRTFGERYIWQVPRMWDLWLAQEGRVGMVQFIYMHIEWILAGFDTKDEDGVSNKQKVNIRSALRKFNAFKQAREFR